MLTLKEKNAKNELTECASQLTGKHIREYVHSCTFNISRQHQVLRNDEKDFCFSVLIEISVIFLLFYCRKLFSKKVADYQFLFRKTKLFLFMMLSSLFKKLCT